MQLAATLAPWRERGLAEDTPRGRAYCHLAKTKTNAFYLFSCNFCDVCGQGLYPTANAPALLGLDGRVGNAT